MFGGVGVEVGFVGERGEPREKCAWRGRVSLPPPNRNFMMGDRG